MTDPSGSDLHGIFDGEFLKALRLHIALWFIFSGLTIGGSVAFGDLALAVAFVLLSGLALSFQTTIYRRAQYDRYQHFRQLEALLTLHNITSIIHPLPHTRMWASSPDFLVLLVSAIKSRKPQVIVELGSGASTIIAAYQILNRPNAYIFSIDHDETYASQTRSQLRDHGLAEKCAVVTAPIRSVEIRHESWNWYDLTRVTFEHEIDLLIVDGPPGALNPLARYPALPLLFEKLSKGALILVDDYRRSSEQQMVERWLKEYALSIVSTVGNEKGAVLLRKN